ncbi:MAG TPA: response regulator [Segetibacter sp.]|jgi:CheY-like chemotaxis protein
MLTKHVVLYADDDVDDIQLVKDAFSNYYNKVELICVADGFEAISYLKNIPPTAPLPCLIILDINMPRMNGKETLAKIRQMKRFENAPAILFTTSSQSGDKAFAAQHNAGFLTKPIDFEQLEFITTTFIERCTDEVKRSIREQIH